MNELRDKFLDSGIPYDDIDNEMIELVDTFNFDLNMPTEYCCSGHRNEDFHVIFHDSLPDDVVYGLLRSMCEISTDYHGCFHKWVRPVGNKQIVSNWIFRSDIPWAEFSDGYDRKIEFLINAGKVLRQTVMH